MAGFPHELREPLVVEIEDEFTRLPEAERVRLTNEWLDSLRSNDPVDLPVTGADMVAEARADNGW